MTEAATSAVPLIPLEVLFGNPQRTQPRLSPGGERLAYIAPVDGVLNVWVGPVGSEVGGDGFEPVTRDTDRGIRQYFWTEDGRHLVYLQDKGGDENWRLYAVDPAPKEIRDLTPFENVQARPLEKNKHFPDELLIELNKRDPQLHDAYRLNLADGGLELVAENPGNIAGWVADVDMRVRGALSTYPDGGFGLLVRKTEEDDWRELLRWGPEDSLSSDPIGFSGNGARMFLKDSRGANAARLVRLDLLTEEVDTLAEDPRHDVSDVLVASRGFRGRARGGSLHVHRRKGHRPLAWRLADQKKSPIAAERDEEARGLWQWLASRFDARRLVFVDGSGFHTSMTRLRARAPRGKRASGKVPRNRGKNTTLIAAITLEGAMGESMTVEGATDAKAFEVYVEHFLAPSLSKGQVVVLDGIGAHRTERVRELIEARGSGLLFLPSYSLDLNPIEEAFSKVKSIVRKVGARTREALVEARGRALSAVTPDDAAGWFDHAGYESQDQPL